MCKTVLFSQATDIRDEDEVTRNFCENSFFFVCYFWMTPGLGVIPSELFWGHVSMVLGDPHSARD